MASLAANLTSVGSGLRIAVCIVGQLSRLEVDSKLANILRPTWEQPHKPEALHVFLALERGGYYFSNIDNGAIHAQQHPGCREELRPSDVRRRFAPWLAKAHYSDHVTREVNLSLWKRYRRERPPEERNTRLQHHLSQFAHMRTCAQLVQAAEVAHRRHYDLILKIRDNTIAVSPLVLSHRHLSDRCWSKGCIEWKGYNDKAMLIPRVHMDGALRDVAEVRLMIVDQTCTFGVGCHESAGFLSHTANGTRSAKFGKAAEESLGQPFREGDQRKFHVWHHARSCREMDNAWCQCRTVLRKVSRVSAEELPLVDGRCTAHGWCLVEEGKDCRPAQRSWAARPCEEVAQRTHLLKPKIPACLLRPTYCPIV
ncbi:MAG: hypothetical protein SGPRY_001044 [Prymnesium sp.]